jgi:hypothetical protein
LSIQVTAVQAADDVVGEFPREPEDLLIVVMLLHRIGDRAALGHDLVVSLLFLGGQRPILAFGLLGDLAGLGQLGA